MEAGDFWGYMSPHLAAVGLAAFCSIESYCVWKANQDPWVMPMDKQRPFVTFWSILLGLPVYMLTNIITSISGTAQFGLPYFKSLPGILGLATTGLGLAFFFNQQIIGFFRRIFGKNKNDGQIVDGQSPELKEPVQH